MEENNSEDIRGIQPKAQLREVLTRIKTDAELVRNDLNLRSDEAISDDLSQEYRDAAYRLECLLVHINSEVNNLRIVIDTTPTKDASFDVLIEQE